MAELPPLEQLRAGPYGAADRATRAVVPAKISIEIRSASLRQQVWPAGAA
jgi:hypothetical protein